jgi:hypothetical protein
MTGFWLTLLFGWLGGAVSLAAVQYMIKRANFNHNHFD